MRIRTALVVVAAITVGACSGSSTAPSAPSPAQAPSVTPAPVVPSVVPPPILPVRGPQFDQTFWDEFVHNSYDAPSARSPLQRLTAAPMLYLKTVDEAGQPIDAFTLQVVEDAVRSVAPTWGGGQFGLAGIEQGTATKAGQRGWLTVKWPNPSAGAFCGRSDVGLDGGVIELNYLRTDITCGCDGSKMRPRTVRHELGHGFGYWHTDNDADVMRNGVNGCADTQPSAREVYHAQLAYQSPQGTTNAIPSRLVVID